MNVIETLLGEQAGDAVEQLGRQFGLDGSQASSALAALLPALAAGFQRRASSPSGLEALLGALSGGQQHRHLDGFSSLGQPETIDAGNGILGQIFGSKDVSREVARRASAQTGIGSEILKQMLPVAASLVMGTLARRQFGGAPARPAQFGASAEAGGLLDALTPLLDSNRDGSMVDDVIGMIDKFMGGR